MELGNVHDILLLSGLLIAVVIDQRRHRIPNWLSLSLGASGIASHIAFLGTSGAVIAATGVLVAFAIMLVPYLMRGLGAGDVKLMAAAGAWLGPEAALSASALTLIAGAGLGMLVLIWRAYRASEAVDRLLSSRFPYAAAIAIGTSATLIVRETSWML